MQEYIVSFKEDLNERHHAKVKRKGGALKHELKLIKAGVYNLSEEAISELSDDTEVEYIAPNRVVTSSSDPAVLDYLYETTTANIARSYGYTGKHIGVAVVDSGVFDHNDLKGTNNGNSIIVYQQNFVKGESDTKDTYGHGTHVAGVLAGNGQLSTGGRQYSYTFRGIAPNVRIVSLRVLDKNGRGTDAAVIAAIDRAIQLKTQYNIRVLNLSLGRPVYEKFTKDPLGMAVERAWKAGIVVVVAAGNEGRNNTVGTEGYGTIMSPGNHPLVITVGAVRTMGSSSRADDLIASYSSKGPTSIDHVVKPDLVAPGNRIVAGINKDGLIFRTQSVNRIPYALYDRSSSGTSELYYRMSGTSMAAPVVSGAVALILEKYPTLKPDAVKARLMRSASKTFPMFGIAYDEATRQTFPSQHDIFTVGAGYLDIWAALNETEGAGLTLGQAASPAAVFDIASGTVRIVTGGSAAWGFFSRLGEFRCMGIQCGLGQFRRLGLFCLVKWIECSLGQFRGVGQLRSLGQLCCLG